MTSINMSPRNSDYRMAKKVARWVETNVHASYSHILRGDHPKLVEIRLATGKPLPTEGTAARAAVVMRYLAEEYINYANPIARVFFSITQKKSSPVVFSVDLVDNHRFQAFPSPVDILYANYDPLPF